MAEVIDPALATAGKPCDLGTDPSKYLEKFEDWYEHTNLLADSIGVKDKQQKLKLLLLWGGKDFRKFTKDAGVLTDASTLTEGETPDNLEQAITKIRNKCGTHVNLSMAIFKLMHLRQGTKSITTYYKELEELSTQCQFDKKPYTKERAMKDAFIFGTSDDKLRQEALAKDFDLTMLMKAALGYEQSRKASGTIKATSDSPGGAVRHVTYTQDDVDNIVARVMAGKYSVRSPSHTQPETPRHRCPNCPPHYNPHEQGKCPAKGKTCVVCKKKNHFAGSSTCKMSGTVKAISTNSDQENVPYVFKETVGWVEVVDINCLKSVGQDNSVNIKIKSTDLQLFVDSGCKKTLIPMDMYTPDMGHIQPTKVKFRPYGTTSMLMGKGEVYTTLESENGAHHQTTIYMVQGHLAEPLLGDSDAKALGILAINKKGYHKHEYTTPPPQGNEDPDFAIAGITKDIRTNGITVNTQKEPDEQISQEEQDRLTSLLNKHQEVFKGIGLLKGEEVKFHIDHSVPPVAASYRPVPLAYREKLSAHLQELRKEGKIEDVSPNENCPWISNVVITEKKQKNQIRMNVDMREPNKALRHTKRHVQTIQEIRHQLKDATRFSEMDMSHGYHQIALSEDSRSIATFQTHEGLHRFKVLFFGPSPSTDLFHDRVKSALAGLPGCMSIHDNILVWGTTPEEHEKNLDSCLTRLQEKGLTLRKEKCTFGATSVSWFGWIFSKSGMSADPHKIQAIQEAGRPQNTQDVKSFLQACQFNAKFMFDSDQAYAQLTRPLRDLTRKNSKFTWTDECEQAYSSIIKTMTSEPALRPMTRNSRLSM